MTARRAVVQGRKRGKMNKMQDGEVRRMAVFKLRQVVRQLAELEACAEDKSTRACLAGVRAALRSAT